MMSFLSFARRRQNQNRRHARRLNGCWERSLCRKRGPGRRRSAQDGSFEQEQTEITERGLVAVDGRDRKSTRLNSSHGYTWYAVFCLQKKKQAACHADEARPARRAAATCRPSLSP